MIYRVGLGKGKRKEKSMKTIKTKSKLLTTLVAFMLVFSLSFTFMGVTSHAATNVGDIDVHGTPIMSLIPQFVYEFKAKFETYDKQVATSNTTYIFIDSQLLEYDFLETLVESYNVTYSEYGIVQMISEAQLWVHRGGAIYTNYSMACYYHYYNGGEFDDAMARYTYDFSNPDSFDALCDMIGTVSMCAVGIWELEGEQFDFWLDLQAAWNDDFPIYVIERDPISWSSDGLLLKYYAPENSSYAFFTDPQ